MTDATVVCPHRLARFQAGNVRTVMGLSAQTWARMSRAWMDVVRQQSRQESEMRAQVGEVRLRPPARTNSG